MAIYYSDETRYVGCVLETRERNYHDDSDFYAIVWNEERQEITTEEYATTRFGGGGSASIDATDEVKAKASAWLKKWMIEHIRRESEENAGRVAKGKRVRVVRGRKVPIGTEGVVIWYEHVKYSYHSSQYRAGIRLDDGSVVFTAAVNCDVIDPAQYLMSEAEIEYHADRWKDVYHAPFSYGRGLAVI